MIQECDKISKSIADKAIKWTSRKLKSGEIVTECEVPQISGKGKYLIIYSEPLKDYLLIFENEKGKQKIIEETIN